ncbi:MAG: GspH/FimT family pseudopilin [Burkholderiales bacterium]|jgi:type IV fimbrial biogenesis protein FimT|nr:prepilin-type N-terminal cleavage/methylation domain-containing protein [Betaproteobacteria bacterium]
MRRTGQSASCKAQQKQRKGFTLTELLAGLSIATLLLALALPRWQGWLAEQRVEAASSRLLSGLAQARAAAIRSGAPVRLCAASAEGSCSTQRQWGFGWLSQRNGSGSWQTVHRHARPPAGVRVEALATGLQEGVLFESRGFAVRQSGGFASGSWVICAEGARARNITLAPSGRARLSTGASCS